MAEISAVNISIVNQDLRRFGSTTDGICMALPEFVNLAAVGRGVLLGRQSPCRDQAFAAATNPAIQDLPIAFLGGKAGTAGERDSNQHKEG